MFYRCVGRAPEWDMSSGHRHLRLREGANDGYQHAPRGVLVAVVCPEGGGSHPRQRSVGARHICDSVTPKSPGT